MRLQKLIADYESSRQQKVDDIGFFIPGEPVQQFGKTFKDMNACLKYCEENYIPYTKEKGCFGWDTYNFPTANNSGNR